jgi:multidrug efflux system outer membrane protein
MCLNTRCNRQVHCSFRIAIAYSGSAELHDVFVTAHSCCQHSTNHDSPIMNVFQRMAGTCLLMMLAACASPPMPVPEAPQRWFAPLPHNGSVPDLAQWWQQQGDPLLPQLIAAAQNVSPTLASAAARISQARATRVASGAALLPTLDAAASVNRASQQSTLPMGTTAQAALQSSWEIDLSGAAREARSAAQARLDGANAGWHEARVSLAAEVANQYYDFRSCDMLLAVARADAASRTESARLVELSAAAGFQSLDYAGLARASAAEGNSRAIQQQAVCDIHIKSLVALTAIMEPALREKLASVPGALPAASVMTIHSVPLRVLAQRPDLFAAERDVVAAAADVGASEAQRYPHLSLVGSVGAGRFVSGGVSTTGDTWSIGPLTLTLPIFDGGRRSANLDVARARHAEATVKYRAAVRQAVRELEEVLVRLDSTAARSTQASAAVEGYRAAFNGTQSRYRNGLASLVELEDARRIRLAAETALIGLQRERVAAWIAAYRAAGGGWTRNEPTANLSSGAQPVRLNSVLKDPAS